MPDLSDQTVLITGAGRGWGQSIARRFAEFGAHVIATSRTESELADLERMVQSAGGSIEILQADLADPVVVDRLAADILEQYVRIDTLVYAAAILRKRLFRDLTMEEIEQTIAVMLMAPIRLAKALFPAMIDAGQGTIINISSRAGVQPFELESDYCAAKYGLEGFSQSIAMELKQHNIAVYTISPGYSDKPIKPTSVTAAEFACWPDERRMQYRDSMGLTEAFIYLAMQEELDFTGQHFKAFALSEQIREHGYGLALSEVITTIKQ